MLRRWAGWPRWIRWLACAAAALLALAFVWALFVPLADWLARHDAGSATGLLHETALDNARGRLLTLGAGLLAAGALWFTARNVSLYREGQVTDRYTKAIEQLGSDKLDVRIGGIYALERIARDSARDHPTVMEVLTAFIREHSREQPSPDPGGPEQERSTRPDVQAALTVIGRRDARRDIRLIDLAGVDLAGAVFTRADLVGAVLSRADLAGAVLSRADLAGADLRFANLTRVTLIGAHLIGADLAFAVLSGADLAGADLTDAYLGHATLLRVDLSRADLTGAYLGLADLTGATLVRTQLTGADLTDARWPEGTRVPEGWELNAGTGRLRRAGSDSGAG